MRMTPITVDPQAFLPALRPYLAGARCFNSSGESGADTIFIDKDGGYFLKSAPAGSLSEEAAMARYFCDKGLGAQVLLYCAEERDWLLTAKLAGEDCTAARYLAQPERLCDALAERLALLHAGDFSGCPVQDRTERWLARAERNFKSGAYDQSHFPDSFGYASAEEAWKTVESRKSLLRSDTLVHGDYCLPNVLLEDWRFSGFIDVGGGGAGDRHMDIFWALWSLWFNLKTDQYRRRFIDAYGRGRVDEERLRVVAAVEVFG